jgi:hypothetical protein
MSADKLKPPDLQEWVARYGGYHKIPWAEWDAAIEQWQAARRQELEQEKLRAKP